MSSDDDHSESRDTGGHSPGERNFSPTATSEESFQEAVRALVLDADSHDVDVRGSWPVVRGDETKVWDVEITSVARSTTAHVDDAGSTVASIVEAVAEREGVDRTELPPLQEAIDPEILETLQRSTEDEQHVGFRYYGYRITVRADGSLVVEG